VTNSNGVYQMKVERGERQIVASKVGLNLDPKPAWINLKQNMNNVNFSTAAACTNPVPNPSFETVPFYWNRSAGWRMDTRRFTAHCAPIQAPILA